jgi:hypothetical protein
MTSALQDTPFSSSQTRELDISDPQTTLQEAINLSNHQTDSLVFWLATRQKVATEDLILLRQSIDIYPESYIVLLQGRNLPLLKHLEFHYQNDLDYSFDLLPFIEKSTNLESIDLSGWDLQNFQIINIVQKHRTLKTITLDQCRRLTPAFLTQLLTLCPHLEQISLHHCPLITSATIRNISSNVAIIINNNQEDK